MIDLDLNLFLNSIIESLRISLLDSLESGHKVFGLVSSNLSHIFPSYSFGSLKGITKRLVAPLTIGQLISAVLQLITAI